MRLALITITAILFSILSGCGTISGTLQGLSNDINTAISIGYELL